MGKFGTGIVIRYNSKVPTVPVELDPPYSIVIEPGLLRSVGEQLKTLAKSGRVGVISDSNVAPHYLAVLEDSLRRSGFQPITTAIPAGERFKTLATVSHVYDVLLAAQIDRRTPVIALGGGVVGDLTGFVAATVLRGVPFIQVPTTLLAMVDASVGGKTGIDHAVGKNLIGAFHQPRAVLIDPEALRTLPPRELRSGLAECIKHDIIRDAEGFARLEQSIERALAMDIGYLTELVAHNVAIKAKVVAADPFEKGERAHLNFGHTFGHAIETVSQYQYAHGECVALGMVAASYAATKLGMLAESDRQRIISVIRKASLPTGGMKLSATDVVNAMAFDKKVESGRLRFVLPDRIGHVVMRDDVPADLVREAVESLRG
jgi:3-dehydroquinate synthase